MIEFIKKPVYTPPSQIRGGLYTEGKKYMYADTLEEYVGLYHTYPNDAVYSEAKYYPEQSRPLIEFVDQSTNAVVLDNDGNDTGEVSANNSQYFRLTEKRFNNHYSPPYFYPNPSQEEYDVGFMTRFIAQKINDIDNITEINADEFDRRNADNKPGIDKKLYNVIKLKWTIDGPIKDVRAANERVIAYAELNLGIKRLDQYLTDLDEFHKNKHKIPE